MNDMTAMTAQDDAPLQIELVDDMPAMKRLRPAWDALLRKDPDSGFYLSWEWMASLFEVHPGSWCVLCLRDPEDPRALCAVLPMRRRLYWSRSRRVFQAQLAAASRLGMGEYTGILCDPARERWAMAALGLALGQMDWSHFEIKYEPTGRRLRMLAAALPKAGFNVTWPTHRINGGKTNQLVVPQIELPDTMEAYYASLSANRRQKLTRARRQMEADPSIQSRLPTPETFHAMRDDVLALWRKRWEGDLSSARIEYLTGQYALFLDRVWNIGALYMPTLWQGEEMIGALSHVADRDSRRMTSVFGARRMGEEKLDIGRLQRGLAIEHAIDEGFRFYDLGHGDETYKYNFATGDRKLAYVEVTRRNMKAAHMIPPEYLGSAMRRLRRLIDREDIKGATAAAAQIEKALAAWQQSRG